MHENEFRKFIDIKISFTIFISNNHTHTHTLKHCVQINQNII